MEAKVIRRGFLWDSCTVNGYNSVDGYSKNYLERYQDWLDKQDPLMEGMNMKQLLFLVHPCCLLIEKAEYLPELIRKKAQLENDALFVGMGRKFRIWEPSSFENYESKAREYLKRRRSTNK